ncbi:hypothetical protein IKG33_03295 [Candidatus Saccharibacteria bacterium]|nr:hypothetical protein [Candidatus Saccharibacteria bacterium]
MKMKNNVGVVAKGLMVMLAIMFTQLFVCSSTFAASSGSSMFKKAALQGLYTCYNGYMVDTVYVGDSPVGPIYQTQSSLLANTGGTIIFPTGSTKGASGANDDKISCGKLFNGAGGLTINGFFAPSSSSSNAIANSGIFGLFGKSAATDSDTLDNQVKFLRNMGYVTESVSGSSNECFSFSYNLKGESKAYKDISDTFRVCKVDYGWEEKSDGSTEGFNGFSSLGDKDGNLLIMWGAGNSLALDGSKLNDKEYVKGVFIYDGVDGSSMGSYTFKFVSSDYEANKFSYYKAELDKSYDLSAFITAARFLSGDSNLSVAGLSYTKAETIDLYNHYLTDYYKVDITCGVTGDSLYNYGSNAETIEKQRIHDDCYVLSKADATKNNKGKNLNKGVRPIVLGKLGDYRNINVLSESTLGYDELVAALKALYADASPEELQELEDIENDPESDVGGEVAEPNCLNSGAAEKLGWIVCPALELMSGATESLYEKAVEPALKVEPTLFTKYEDQGTKHVWEIFQGIANTIFIALLLVVIFSQLTGVGIDNYGIKKILPKLIVAVILINLSYILCLVSVDLSNIVGSGIQDMFNNINIGVDTASVTFGGKEFLFSLGSTALTGAGILGVLMADIWVVVMVAGPQAILLALVIATLSILAAVFSLFALLAARKAAIVVLVVLSPIAFVCYMLPNTKKLFDKWLKFFEAMLLLYPICGLLVGGGNFVSKLLLVTGAGDGGFFSAFMAMIIGVVPIFFIPTALKGSFAMMGKIGDGIMKIGNGVGDRMNKAGANIDKAVRGSERFKNNAAEFQRNRTLKASERNVRRLQNKQKSGGRLSESEERALARSQQTVDKMNRENRAARAILAEKEYEGSLDVELEDELSTAMDSGDMDKVEALSKALITRKGAAGAKKIGDLLAEKSMYTTDASGNRVVNDAMVKTMSRYRDMVQHDSAFAQHMRGKASDAFGMMSAGGAIKRNDDGTIEYGDLGYFARKNEIAKTDSDFASQGSTTLKRAIESGGLTKDRVEQLLNSEDHSVQTMLSDEGKRTTLQAFVYRENHKNDPNVNLEEMSDADASLNYAKEKEAVRNAEESRKAALASNVEVIANALTGAGTVTSAGASGSAGTPIDTSAASSGSVSIGSSNPYEIHISHRSPVDTIKEIQAKRVAESLAKGDVIDTESPEFQSYLNTLPERTRQNFVQKIKDAESRSNSSTGADGTSA